jgi:hypothetical protein
MTQTAIPSLTLWKTVIWDFENRLTQAEVPGGLPHPSRFSKGGHHGPQSSTDFGATQSGSSVQFIGVN